MTTEIAPRHLIALAPYDLPIAQRELAEWCRAHIVALGRELREQRTNLRECRRMLWRSNGWTNAIARTRKRMIYFAKLQAAVRAGYLVVPNFDVDVIAVRVGRLTPDAAVGEETATPDVLPPGRGRYVDDALVGHHETKTWKDHNQKEQSRQEFHPSHFGEQLDFPGALVKPAILDAANRAMALRLFDRIGIVRGRRRSDPILVGQIIDPRTPRHSLRWSPKCVSFFVAWWLNTEDLQ